MLVDLKRTVSYICPMCSNISTKRISVFDFSGSDKIRLICPTHGCREVCAVISAKGEKYNISVECPLCGEKHSYTASRDSFWHKRLLEYKCGAAGMDIFFAGSPHEVQQAIEDNTDSYSDALADEWRDLDDFEPWHDEDYSILFEVIDRLNALKNTGRVSCRCGCEDIDINVAGNGIILQCMRCKRTKVIEADDEMLTRLLNTSQIVIGN